MTLHTGRLAALLVMVLSFMLTSCENDHNVSQGKGKVMLSLHSDIVIKSVEPLSDVSDYNFRFVGVGDYGTSEYYRFGDVSWPFEWYFGVFRLQAESCTVQEADEGYGKWRYEGISQQFEVANDRMATASVLCKVANVNVNVVFDDSMMESFYGMKLAVDTVVPELAEDGTPDPDSGITVCRSLEFDAIDRSGYYSLPAETVLLRYTLYLKTEGAEEYVETKTGYFTEGTGQAPAFLKAGDLVTLRVIYTGTPIITPGIKFVISGERTSVDNSVSLDDYAGTGTVVEDSRTEVKDE